MGKTFMAPVSWGLGDLVVSLPVVQALIDAGGETYLVTRSNLQEQLAKRVEGLAGVVSETGFDPALLTKDDTYINLRDHDLQKNYWWGGAEFERDYPGLCINDILEIISRHFLIAADFSRLQPMHFVRRSESLGKIIFLPGSDGTYKCWLADYWSMLAKQLEWKGLSCLVIGEPNQSKETKDLLELGMPWIDTPTVGDAVDLISSSTAVVGVDTGLMHVAVNQGVPTLGLFRNGPIYVRHYPHVRTLIAKECHSECRMKQSSSSYNEVTSFRDWTGTTWCCTIPDHVRCMASIDPGTVLTEILSLIQMPRPK